MLAITLGPQAEILGLLFPSEVCCSSPFLRLIAFCLFFFFFACVILPASKKSAACVTSELQLAGEEVTSGCSSRSPAQSRAQCAPTVHLCYGRQQTVNRHFIFFLPRKGPHHQDVVQQKSLRIKEAIRSLFQSRVCLWHCR